MRAIETCRTANLGGHKVECRDCGEQWQAYNSCRNRHCPKCQTLAKAQWLSDRKTELLPVPYFHCVFTLPHDLNPLVLSNKRLMLSLLFASASKTLLEFGRNNLGGKVGFTMVLHTWDQLLRPHFHLHCVIPAGALAEGRQRWIHGSASFLFPVKALSRVFRGKLIEGLDTAWANGRLRFPSGIADLATKAGFVSLLRKLRATDWVVYAKRPFAGPEQVLDYLGRYTHRVAISNHRVVDLSQEHVSFTYRDRRNGDAKKTATLTGHDFITRFLLHVLPHGFMRIRHFGLLASRTKAADLGACRCLLGLPEELPPRPRLSVAEWMKKLLGVDVSCCPACGGHRLLSSQLPPSRLALQGEVMDTS